MSDVQLGSGRFQIHGDASGATNAANQANNALAALNQQVNTGWWGLQNLGAAFAALPAAVAAGVGVAIKYAADWEDAMVGVERTTGLQGEALAKLEGELKNIASIRPVATVEVAGVAEAAGALGVLEQDIGRFTKAVVDFSSLTGMTTQASATGLARIAALTNVAGAGFENLASSIYTVGVNTAATEEEIIAIGTRLAGTASAVGLTADELVGLSAAIRSAGIRSEMGATAIQKTFFDMNNSISENGDNLERWAALAGTSSADFAQRFKSGGAMQMFAQVVSNMGNMAASGEDVIGMLVDLGITEARQQQALLVMAKAQDQTANSNAKLTSALAYAREGMLDTTSALDAADRRAQTFNGQVQILRNNIFQLGASFGQSMGFAKSFVSFLSDLVRGISAIPGPVKTVAGILTLLVAGFSALAAFFLLVGGRVLLAVNSFKQLHATLRMTAAAEAQIQASSQGTATQLQAEGAAVDTNRGKWVQLRNEKGQFAGKVWESTAAIETETAALKQQNAIVGMAKQAWANHRTAIIRSTVAMGTMLASTIALTYWTAKAGDAAEQAQRQRERANAEGKRALIEGIEAEINGHKGASNAALASLPAYQRASAATAELGMSHELLGRIIRNSVSHTEFNDWMDEVTAKEDAGSKTARNLRQDVSDLHAAFTGAEQVLGVTGRGLDDFTASTKAAADAAKDAADAQEQYNAAIAKAQAHIDYIGAQFAAREAVLSLRDAERELAEARANAANPAQEIRRLELELAQARQSQASAADDVQQAELELGRARQEGRDDLADAEDDLADSQDDYLDSLAQIKEMEEALAKLRAGPTIEELTKATNKLRDAQLSLISANRKVADSEWYLQHLREEGASARDIADAEHAIAVARQDAANAQQEITDAQAELDELTDPIKRAEAIAEAERELAAARRDAAKDLRDMREAEQDLADIRRKVANDGYYKDALAALTDARLREQEAIRNTRTAEQELQNFRLSGNDAVERAQLRYEQALYNVATANAEVTKQTALMRGETWDAGDAAAELARQLGLVSANVPDAAARKRMADFISVLRGAPNPEEPGEAGADAGPGLGGEDLGGVSGDAARDFGEQLSEDLQNLNWLQILLPVGAMILGQILAAMLVSAGASAALVAALPFIIVGLIIAGIAALLLKDGNWKKVWNAIKTAWSNVKEWAGIAWQWVQGLWDGFTDAVGKIFSSIGNWLYDRIVRPIMAIFGIRSPSTVFANIGRSLIEGLRNGITNAIGAVMNFFYGLGSRIIGAVSGAGSWLINNGYNALIGFKNGIINGWNATINFLGSIPGRVAGFFKGAATWLVSTGKNIVIGLANGIASLIRHIPFIGDDIANTLVNSINSALGVRSPSRVFHEIGQNVVRGFVNGIESQFGSIDNFAQAMAEHATPDINMKKMLGDMGLEYLLGPNGVGTIRVDTAALKQMALDRPTVNNYETLNLDAITSADPSEIVNEYVWAKRVRLRGGGGR